MKKASYIIIVFITVFSGYLWAAAGLQRERDGFMKDRFLEYTIPSELLGPLSMEFKGLASDLLLAKFMIFIGGRTTQLDSFDNKDWASIKHTLDTITDLDPYYWDAYLFSQVFLTWKEDNYRAANNMLLKAKKYLPGDYRIPYYIGLNYYKFANDTVNGSKYIMEASKLPGSPFYLAGLAARLSAYSSDYQRGIIFLREMMGQTTSPEIVEHYKLRIQVLERMHLLEQLVSVFQTNHNRRPSELEELVEKGYIKELPRDPYGGKFLIQADGKINVTSKMVKK